MLSVLKIRRDKMPEAVMGYYRFLQNNPKKVEKVKVMMEARAKKAEDIKHPDEAGKKAKEKE
jgi:hypothetical protein